MTFQNHPRTRRVASALSTLSTLSLVAYSSALLTPVHAQTPVTDRSDRSDRSDTSDKSDRADTTSKPKVDSLTQKKKKEVLPPGNPAVLIDPTTGVGNKTNEYNKDGTRRLLPERKVDYGDHQRNLNDPRAIDDPKDLPVYGYSFFAQARRAIELRRRAMERALGGLNDMKTPRTKTRVASKTGVGISTGRPRDMRDTPDDGTDMGGVRRRTGNDTDNTDDTTTRKTQSRTTDSSDTGDDTDNTDTTTHRRVRRSNTDASDNSDTPDDQNMDDTTSRRRTRRSVDADNTDNTDNTDDTDNTDAANRRDARNADASSTEEALRNEDALHQQRMRELRGLPPLSTDGRQTTTRRRTSGDTTDDGYGNDNTLTGRSSRTRANTSRSANNDTGSLTDNYNNYNNESGRNSPVSAFYQIVDPLTQLTNNIIASAPATYQLSGGDAVLVHISTPRLDPRDISSTVDQTGSLDLKDLGRYVVRGKTLDQLQSELQQTIGRRYYKNATVAVSLEKLRTIAVTVQGEAVLPGPYNVPAVMTAFNVLYASGGPTEDGSLRDIKVIRQGKEVGTLDFYKFIAGKSQSDIPLQAGDVIVIAPNGARVALLGEVRHPAQYELRDGETLKDVLAYSGGIKASGVDQFVQLNTLEPGQNRVLKNVNLRDQAQVANAKLYDGDSVEIHSLRQIVDNKVTIRGAVTQPSDYALTPNMHVADLLVMARNPLSEAYLGRAALNRWNPDNTTTLIPIDLSKAMQGDESQNIPLMKWDVLEVYSQQEAAFVGKRNVFVNGAVQRPGNYEHRQNMHLSDVLLKAGGPLKDAESIELIHQHGDHTYKIENVRVADIVHGDKSRDLAVEDDDIVAVYTNKQAGYMPEHVVRIEGEVNTPGFYPRGEGMKLTDLLRMAGKFRPGASPKVVIAHSRRAIDAPDNANAIVKVQFDGNQQCAPQDDVRLEDGDVVAVQGNGNIEDHPAVVRIIGAVNTPGPIILKNKQQRLSDAIREAGGLRPEAFAEGAEFNRDPTTLNSKTQRDLAVVVGALNNLLNDSRYKGQLAKSDIERLKALNTANTDSILPTSSGGANNAVAAASGASELFKHDLVTAPRRLTDKELDPSGNIAINLPAALEEAKRGGKGVDDILLKDGDTIIVPEKQTTIQVIGAVTNQRGVLYVPGKPLAFYVAQAGDFTPDAAKDRIVVIHAGGGIIPSKNVHELRPGDVILVPTKVLAEKISQNSNGFGDIFRSLTNSAILFKVATGVFGL
jgi:protein involved in polysaccharide export with SLBB domain